MTQKINKVGVIGSGAMGSSIAALCAGAGLPVVLLDIVPPDLKEDEKNIPEARNRIVNAGLAALLKANPSPLMDQDNLMLIRPGNIEDNITLINDCDLIIEAIVEDLKIKQALFARLDKVRKKDAVIASNTSGLPVKAMGHGRSKEFNEHFLIMHFFNPPRYMHLLEIVKGAAKKEAYQLAHEFGERVLGKGIVQAKDSPGFVGNRIGISIILQSLKLLESGNISIPEIDAIFGQVFGMPKTGLFALSDMVGLDIIGHLADNSYKLLQKDEFREIYKIPEFFRNMLNNRMLGDKTPDNGGFYKRETDPKTKKKIKKVIDAGSLVYKDFDVKMQLLDDLKNIKSLAQRQTAIIDSLPFAAKLAAFIFVYSANRIPEISDNITEIDNAMKWGFSWEAGPFEIWDNYGLKKSVKLISDAGFKLPAKIKKMMDAGNKSFYKIKNGRRQFFDFRSGKYKDIITNESSIYLHEIKSQKKNIVKTCASATLLDIGDGIYDLEYHTRSNAVNKEMIDFSFEAGEYVRSNGTGMVIGNQVFDNRPSFSAGADLSYMLTLAKSKNYSEIDKFVRDAVKTIQYIQYAPFPVIAAPYGMTLGGGCEMCLAADRIVTHAELYMGLVEIGAGLIPAGGGMVHLWQRYMESIPKEVSVTDMAAYFIPAFMDVANAKVSKSAAEAKKMCFLRPTDRIVFNNDFLIGEAKKEALRMAEDNYMPPAKKHIPVMGKAAQGMVLSRLYDMIKGFYLTPHLKFILQKAAYCMSGGEAFQGQTVSEDYLFDITREAFVELWKTPQTVEMAEHMLKTGRPLLM
jgi:3-hydroxyacyl-CoA dehydrogenase